jgi:hypothetical protein
MFNPILSEIVARERFKDYIREAEQSRLAEAMIAPETAKRFELTISLGNLVIAVRQLFKALTCASCEQ